MGLPVPDPPDDYGMGDDCLGCHPAGKTPNYVWVRFWDIAPRGGAPTPPNGYPFICKQDPHIPCYYFAEITFEGNLWRCYYHAWIWDPVQHKCEIQLLAVGLGFGASFYANIEACAVDFDNDPNIWVHPAGTGGHAHVTVYVDPIIIALTSCYHFATIPGVLHEHQDVGMDHAIYKLNHRSDKTNILILLDKEELELPW